ncbi:hypothetical protein AR457_00700 [Streptomyces agglomeratus]|uniref:TrwC relaxase domain-containing protein n=1 Tax=Streptomyces agglomeratus TaxID=285458 RepID=A0A1E5P149_9ACTN|nr:relaxase domain-containing protein [Streptomyces agglomeratus]OEJ23278.1 hypothetical protein AS594_00900 [Streptomyces agglomeratus]OEJ42851.1 hypothetical protein AR457_00700 [Streptomyces agglomeratus]OEJ55214.1 hypothetical protein BGK72_34990 [Streptomyces agglomeratus]OEJ62586.1 hypothetical protein BGM19_35970 [Streptomyces agglomeratus]
MTAKGITAKGYHYYRRIIATGDGAQGSEPTVSSTVPGVPHGIWHGLAARALGLEGVVTEPQMRALSGLGKCIRTRRRSRPGSWALGASLRQAVKAAKLGPAVPRLSERSPLDQSIEQVLQEAAEQLCRPLTKAETGQLRHRTAALAFAAEYHRAPADGAELGRYLTARTGPQRRGRTGYDLTFASQELSLLFALGDPDTRRIVLGVLVQARSETVSWLDHPGFVIPA